MSFTTVSSQTIDQNIWRNFYDLIKDNVTSVTIQGSGGANSKTVKVQTWASAFPDKLGDDSTDYPIIVINDPEGDFSNLTFRKSMDKGSIIIEVFATQAEAVEKFKDKIRYQVLLNRSGLAGVGIENIQISDEDSSREMRGAINLHIRRIRFSFEFTFTSW